MKRLSTRKRWQRDISKQTQTAHKHQLYLCRKGIDILLCTFDALGGLTFDTDTADGAASALCWRYVATIPNTTLWCLDAAANGQYRISMILLRPLIEEVVNLRYYVVFPVKALETVGSIKKNFLPNRLRYDRDDIKRKMKAIGIPPKDSLMSFYNEISELFSHPNTAHLLSEYVDNLIFVKEPSYIENVIETILIHLVRLEYIAIGSIKERFPELENNHNWKNKAYAFDKEASKWITN